MVEQTELESIVNAVTALAPPKSLPEGWILKESRSQPGYHFYFNHLTGECSWFPPVTEEENQPDENTPYGHLSAPEEEEASRLKQTRKRSLEHVTNSRSSEKPLKAAPPGMIASSSTTATAASSSSGTSEPESAAARPSVESKKRPSKRAKPEQVRVLHILKKHKGARRPSSWRVPTITISKEEAIEELKGLLELLHEVNADPKELRATMEELARTESDCSSAKRGGDLGFFGPKKMQPAFEEASFKLDIGQLSDIVDTSSGVHVILRIG
jgi:peptidyl-prolyl cis-trans isomerase NIMA-interacting 1